MADLPTCKVCFRKIDSPSDAVMISALGRKLFLAHRGACADRAKSFALSTVRRASLELGSRLEEKYPIAFGFAKTLIEHIQLRRTG